jgi:hypothetical protein
VKRKPARIARASSDTSHGGPANRVQKGFRNSDWPGLKGALEFILPFGVRVSALDNIDFAPGGQRASIHRRSNAGIE